jgi:hypothetical protein
MSLADFEFVGVEEFRGLNTLVDKRNLPSIYARACDNCAFLPGSFGVRPGTKRRYALTGTPITSISRTANVVSITTIQAHFYVTGQSITISGVTPSGFNGNFAITVTGSTTFTYSQTGINESGSGGSTVQAPAAVTCLQVFQSIATPFRYLLWVAGGAVHIYDTGTIAKTLKTTSGTHAKVAEYLSKGYVCLSNGKQGVETPRILANLATGYLGSTFEQMTVSPAGYSGLAFDSLQAGGACAVGLHKLGVIFETASGFLSAPGNRSGATFMPVQVTVTSGNQKIRMTVGAHSSTDPTVARRWLVMTLAGLDSYYIVPDSAITTISGSLTNNAGTATVDISLSDASLGAGTLVDKNFLYTSPLPSMAGSIFYHNRHCMWGNSANLSLLYISEVGEPEAFRSDHGFVDVNRGDGQRITNAFILGNTLYICKEHGLWATEDNGGEPSSWTIYKVSESVGTPSLKGVVVSDPEPERGIEARAWILDTKGLYSFSGGAPTELSDIIQPTWETLERANMYLAEVGVNQSRGEVYCLVPSGIFSGFNDAIYMMDFQEGLERRKWSKWTDNGASMWRSMVVYTGLLATDETTTVILGTGNHQKSIELDDATYSDIQTNDTPSSFPWLYRSGILAGEHGLLICGAICFHSFNKTGVSQVLNSLKIYRTDEVLAKTFSAITLTTDSAKDTTKQLNLRSEYFQVEFSALSLDAATWINRLGLYLKPDGVRAF